MKKAYLFLIVLSIAASGKGQQLYLEAFPAISRTSYGTDMFSAKKNYLTAGARLAAGSDHFQIGGEYRTDLTKPSFESGTATLAFKETFYGGFLRYKIARYPAMRMGLVLKAGAGVFNTTVERDAGGVQEFTYDPIVGVNGGAGISIPLTRPFMIEIGYSYIYQKRPALATVPVPAHTASYHLFSAGLSLNFVFGKRKKEYDRIRQNSRFQNGWRG
ncbi:MAG: hypothetical protein H6577_20785 [Lewinellaceae bacterium]|nr:hypothetical protein [Saprospiraceae bacterium]MCB9340568.1 hypothetical protein [Lewinellaceae bacterium]